MPGRRGSLSAERMNSRYDRDMTDFLRGTAHKESIHTDAAPAAIGPYSQAIRSGDLLFTSGQVGLEPATGQMVPGGVDAEIVQVLNNLQAVLAAAGLGFSDVVKTTIFLKNLFDFQRVNAVYGKAFEEAGAHPARSTVEVSQLPRGAQVEIEFIARYPA